MASIAACAISAGPSVSGKPWPRLMAPVRAASADISAKIVVPKPWRRDARNGASAIRAEATGGSTSDRVSLRLDHVHAEPARRRLAPELAGGAVVRVRRDV